MKLPSLLLIFFTLLSTLTAQSRWGNGDRVKGNGDVQTEDRDISGNFSEVDVCCALKVMLRESNSVSVKVEAEENIIPLIVTEVKGNRLVIKMRNGYSINSTKPMKVFVDMPRLSAIDASGASKVIGAGTFSGSELSVSSNGASTVDLAFEGEEVRLKSNGASKIALRGQTERLSVNASSASSIRAQDLIAQSAVVDANSASSVRLHVTGDLDAEAHSASSIRYLGNPDRVNREAHSASSVKKM